VMFQVRDRYVRATAASHQAEVYKDSCVEFFFTPGPDVSKGYFNLEMTTPSHLAYYDSSDGRQDPRAVN
ncbi:MAG: diguanylate cyclase, partial [Proteobacteria bacterium]|nr:diguanylate cyclase [Pseudomonadota bacterium]